MIPPHHIAVSTWCHEYCSAGYLGSRPLTSSIGYPKALAERTSDLPNVVSSRPNCPRPKLYSIRAPLHQYICGIERSYVGTRKKRCCRGEVVELLRVAYHDLFDFFDGSVTQNLRTHPAGYPSGCRAKSWAVSVLRTSTPRSAHGIAASIPALNLLRLPSRNRQPGILRRQRCLNVDNPQSESSSYVRPP